MTMGRFGQRLDVADIAGRITDTFAIDCGRVLVDNCIDRTRMVGFGKSHADAETGKNVSEQRMGRTIKLRHGNDIRAHSAYIEGSVVHCRLTGTHAHPLAPSFEGCDACFEYFCRRITDASVAIAFNLEVEQRSAMFGTVERMGHTLINRHRNGPSMRIAIEPAMHGDRLTSHWSNLLNEQCRLSDRQYAAPRCINVR